MAFLEADQSSGLVAGIYTGSELNYQGTSGAQKFEKRSTI